MAGCPRCGHISEESKEAAKETAQRSGKRGDFFAAEKKGIKAGVRGGIGMMAIAVVWFVVGLAIGIIFFYPPILFVIGLYAFLKGIVTGNVRGEK